MGSGVLEVCGLYIYIFIYICMKKTIKISNKNSKMELQTTEYGREKKFKL